MTEFAPGMTCLLSGIPNSVFTATTEENFKEDGYDSRQHYDCGREEG